MCATGGADTEPSGSVNRASTDRASEVIASYVPASIRSINGLPSTSVATIASTDGNRALPVCVVNRSTVSPASRNHPRSSSRSPQLQ